MIFCLLLLAHWTGDFLFQTSDMATKKSHSVKWLGIHVLTYTVVLFCFSVFIFDFKSALYFTIINGLLHLLTDFITSKVISHYTEKPRVFYPILGFDQMVHTLTLYVSFLMYYTF